MASRGRCDVHLADADYINAYIIPPIGTVYSIQSFPLKSAHVGDTSSRDFDAHDAPVNFIRNLLIRYILEKKRINRTKEGMIDPKLFYLLQLLSVLYTVDI